MHCEVVPSPNGGNAIVCFSGPRKRCPCGKRATRLCDWKVPGKKSGTCDKPLCANCSTVPAPEKDLCSSHAVEYERWKAARDQLGAAK